MKRLVSVLYLLAAAGNLLPALGVISAARLEALYGVPIADANLVVLMRHRAVLLGIVGALLAGAAFGRRGGRSRSRRVREHGLVHRARGGRR